ncbi:MAG: hypothetical protein ACK583_08215, partial [Cyanobacteriota bacterium]
SLIVFLLIEQASERRLFAQQCFNSFLKMLGKLPMVKADRDVNSVSSTWGPALVVPNFDGSTGQAHTVE